jgi:TIR domain
MAKIFLSYRRDDSIGVAGRIYDRLHAHFGPDSVFRDIDNIPFGVDFREYIDSAVGQCDLVLVVVGKNWAGGTDTHRRIDDPRDFVRIEIESALKRNIPVIPILIDRTTMPTEADLPPSLTGLTYRNAIDVDQGRDFHPHVDRLTRGIEFHFERKKPAPASSVSHSQDQLAPTKKFPAYSTSESAPFPSWAAADEPCDSQATSPSGGLARVFGRLSDEASAHPKSLEWVNPRLTRVLAALHFIVGVPVVAIMFIISIF